MVPELSLAAMNLVLSVSGHEGKWGTAAICMVVCMAFFYHKQLDFLPKFQQPSHQDWMKLVLKCEAQLALRSSDIEFKSIPSPREAESSLRTAPDELVSQIFTA